MKKILMLLCATVLLTVNAYAVPVLSLAVGGNLNSGEVTVDSGGGEFDYDYDGQNVGIQAELTADLLIAEVGAGISYEPGYKIKGTSTEFDAMPVYLLAKMQLFPVVIEPYLVAKVGTVKYLNEKPSGVNFDDGKFYALGAGVQLLDQLQVEALYSIRKNDVGSHDYTHKVFSISASYIVF